MKWGVHGDRAFLDLSWTPVSVSCPWNLASASVYPPGASAPERVCAKAGASLTKSSAGSGQRGACPTNPTGPGSPPAPPPSSLWERICFLVRACSSPSTLAWNLTMDSQAQGSSSARDKKQGKKRELSSHCSGLARGVLGDCQAWEIRGTGREEWQDPSPPGSEAAVPGCLSSPWKPCEGAAVTAAVLSTCCVQDTVPASVRLGDSSPSPWAS